MTSSRWRPRFAGVRPDPILRSWLTEPASLTARCQQASRQFAVRVLHFGKGQPLGDDIAQDAATRAPVWVREVALLCDGVPVIFAHTTRCAAQRGRLGVWMARLGSRSLGSLLFAHPGFRRGEIEFLRLDARHPLYRRARACGSVEKHLWARRSVHRLDGQRVVVTEVFLPAIRQLSSTSQPNRPLSPV